MADAYWWSLPPLYVGPLSLNLRRYCRLKGSLSMESHSIAIHVNGTRIVADVEPRVLLVHFLREQASLTGTHIGCDTSQCGACTVRLAGGTVKSSRGGAEVRQAAPGCLCPCSGYQNIVDAVVLAAKLQQPEDLQVVEAS